MDKTCKSSGIHEVAIFCVFSGARVRNTWAICHEVWNNPAKAGLIPDVEIGRHLLISKAGDRKA